MSERPDLNRILAIGLTHAMTSVSIGVTGDASSGGVLHDMNYAAGAGLDDTVRTLIQQGANIEARDNDEWTPLFAAAHGGHDQVVRTLIQQGANIEARDNDGWTPLFTAAQYGHDQVVRTLIEHGANVEAHDDGGWTPLFHAAVHGRDEVGRTLLNAGAQVDHRGVRSWTALIETSYWGYDSFARILIDRNATVNYQATDGLTALMVATKNGHVLVVRLLLERGAAVDRTVIKTQLYEDWTALMFAAFGGHNVVASILLDVGASVNIGHLDKTALTLAIEYENPLCVRQLLRAGASISPDDLKMAFELSVGELAVIREKGTALASIALSLLPVGLLILLAVEPWSTKNHELFSAATRSQAVEILRLGYLLADTSLFEGESRAILDTWRDNIMPLALER